MFAAVLAFLVLLLFIVLLWILGWQKIVNALRVLSHWARYAYFLRFSLLLWLFALILCVVNMISSTLTSGIVAPETWQQYVCVAFFLVSAAFIALILARIVLINGPERWDRGYNAMNDARPPRVAEFLVGEHVPPSSPKSTERFELASFLVWQIPNVLVYAYLIVYGWRQGVAVLPMAGGLLGGTVLAGFFWWLANAFYYLTWVARPLAGAAPTRCELGINAARTILFPRRWFALDKAGEPLSTKATIESASTDLSISGIAVSGDLPDGLEGYGNVTGGRFYLYEAHQFAIIQTIAFLILYLAIWPLTAPVPAPIGSWIALCILVLIGAGAVVVFRRAKPPGPGASLVRIKTWLTIGVVVFLGTVILLYGAYYAERFPILASVLILVAAAGLCLGGIGFLLDRYRVPVITLIILCMAVPRMLHLDRTLEWSNGIRLSETGQEEHYLSTSPAEQDNDLPTPAAIMKDRLDRDDEMPLIIVTSTGGGLHASAWTAAVLANLEQRFDGGAFHRHLLLASTVSGGSVGLLAYLRELHEGSFDTSWRENAYMRMQSAAQCSSLEGVGWGLIYYDLPKAFVPVLPYLVPPSKGDGDLGTGHGATPLFKDRTWALRKSFERNLNNPWCGRRWALDQKSYNKNFDLNWDDNLGKISPDTEGLTLRKLPPSSAIPAFTMNTTSVEDGNRFLLANYDILPLKLDDGPNYRAKSFIGTFNGGPYGKAADLPLATAAQMSATFPYVSSATRVPVSVDHCPDPSHCDHYVGSVHFVDGGYYDNDGTSSAIEFLRYSLAPPDTESAFGDLSPNEIAALKRERDNLKAIAEFVKTKHRVRVLIVEIRNSGDNPGTGPESAGAHSGDKNPWNVLSQIGAPPLGFWQAGHESVTPRNRVGLGLLEHALADKLEVQRVVFADNRAKDVTGSDPLNWSLTPAQRREVQQSAQDPCDVLPSYWETKCIFNNWDRVPAIKQCLFQEVTAVQVNSMCKKDSELGQLQRQLGIQNH